MKGMKGINTKYVLVGLVVVVTVVLLVVVQTKQPKIKNSVKKGLKDNAPNANATQPNGLTETDVDATAKAMGGPAGGTGSNINIPNTQEGFSGFSGFSRGGAGQCFSGSELNSDSE